MIPQNGDCRAIMSEMIRQDLVDRVRGEQGAGRMARHEEVSSVQRPEEIEVDDGIAAPDKRASHRDSQVGVC